VTLAACATASCSDSRRNGDETDVDCGGTCPQCGEGKGCSQALDCASHICEMAPGCTVTPCKLECMVSPVGTADGGVSTDAGFNVNLGGKPCSDASECDDHNPCTQDQCVPSGGNEFFTICYNQPLSNIGCDDGDACTANDSCQQGACTGTAVVCPAIDQCHQAGMCNSLTGCPNPEKDDGTAHDGGELPGRDVRGRGPGGVPGGDVQHGGDVRPGGGLHGRDAAGRWDAVRRS
jgi:hypothetical protein